MLNVDLHNKVAVVTGSGSGIGKGTTTVLARSGCSILLVDINKESLEEACTELKNVGRKVQTFAADVSSEEEIQRLATFVQSTYGRLDILCNIAGITRKKPVFDMESDEWDKVINVNLRSVFLTCKYLGKIIKDSRESDNDFGKVINIASVGSFQGIPLSSGYCASKGGVHILTKVLSTEWAQYKITVNAIVPGYIKTPLSSGVLKDPDAYKKVTSSIPMGKLGNVFDVANAILFLVSQSSNYITGIDLPVDGGFLSSAYTVDN